MRNASDGYDASALPPTVAGTVATVGTFDGIHLGHKDILDHVSARARALGLASMVVTFDPHPLRIVNPAAAPPLLTTAPERLEILAATDVEYLAILPFTQTLQRYSAAHFVDEVLLRRYRVRELVIGYDHGLGRGREGDAELLRALGERRGFAVQVVEAVLDQAGHPISSTHVRTTVAAGDLTSAACMLGRPYSVCGTVVRGDRRGRLLGFPTINIGGLSPHKLLPPEGVYAVRVQTPAGAFGGMMNLGPRPTFGDAATSLEAHLFDMAVTLYEAAVKVEFVARLRATQRFAGPQALVAQLERDAQDARRALTLVEHAGNLRSSPRNLTS
ncbi:MAG TPA: bifunctional riboflavin kinase/FAD synthetase [Gemmatimonadaceae bacterium]|nr:bifunctional riboflavin kinase/FAD synthetase [Gemmatimonadaceae bacterium]